MKRLSVPLMMLATSVNANTITCEDEVRLQDEVIRLCDVGIKLHEKRVDELTKENAKLRKSGTPPLLYILLGIAAGVVISK